MALKLYIDAGFALDLITCDEQGIPWGLSKAAMQQKALQLLENIKPTTLVLRSSCTMFSIMHNPNIGKMKQEDVKARTKEAVAHFAFCVLLRLCSRRKTATL